MNRRSPHRCYTKGKEERRKEKKKRDKVSMRFLWLTNVNTHEIGSEEEEEEERLVEIKPFLSYSQP